MFTMLLCTGLVPAPLRAAVDDTAAVSSGQAQAQAQALRPFEARYNFSWRGLNAGTARFTLRQLSAQEWSYSSRTEPRGLFRLISAANATLQSRMSITPSGVQPLHFTALQGVSRAAGTDAPTTVIDFDWTRLRATGHVDEVSVDMALRVGVQDDLSVQVALMHALVSGSVPADISLFDKSGIRDYAYTKVGSEILHTPLGDVATDVYRSQRAGSPRSTRFWCAPALGYVPLRAEQRRDDELEWRMDLLALQRD